MVLVAHEPEVVVGEIEDRLDAGVELHSRERVRRACELGIGLVQVVEIQVCVSQGVHELAGLEPGDLGNHQREQRVRRDVERFTAIHPSSSGESRRSHHPLSNLPPFPEGSATQMFQSPLAWFGHPLSVLSFPSSCSLSGSVLFGWFPAPSGGGLQ